MELPGQCMSMRTIFNDINILHRMDYSIWAPLACRMMPRLVLHHHVFAQHVAVEVPAVYSMLC